MQRVAFIWARTKDKSWIDHNWQQNWHQLSLKNTLCSIADDMALIKNSTPFDSIKKKFSGSDEIHFRNRKKDNATIGVRVKNPYDGGNSEAQKAVRETFKTVRAQVDAIMADPEQRASYEAKYNAQKKYLSLRGYIFAKEYEKIGS